MVINIYKLCCTYIDRLPSQTLLAEIASQTQRFKDIVKRDMET